MQMELDARHGEARILVVDDERASLQVLRHFLDENGFDNVCCTSDPLEVVQLCESFQPDLVLLDLRMEPIDGFKVLEELRHRAGRDQFLPVLVLTGDISTDAKRRALALGAKDFVTKPFDWSEIGLRIDNLLETRFLNLDLKTQNFGLEQMVRARTQELWNAVTQLERSEREVLLSRDEMIQRLAAAAEFRDDDTGPHLQRMSRYCELMANQLHLPPDRVELIRLASQLHDIGKIAIPDAVLLNPGLLSPDERVIMETHAEKGYRILGGSRSELMNLAAAIAYTHHERIDGTGYPRGLSGDEIPLEGKIAAIADVFDALTSDRVYRAAFPLETALDMMKGAKGSHFDPDLLEMFLGSLDSVLVTRARYQD